MARISREQLDGLREAIRTHDFLHRVLREIECLHRVVFHANERADWGLVRASAEQVLTAEIVSRHRGEIDGVYWALRSLERQGKSWSRAIQELANTLHSYYTTPLGVVMRADLFGEEAVFITPDAADWIRQQRGSTTRAK